MKYIWKFIKTIFTIICLIVVIGGMIIIGPSVFSGSTDSFLEELRSSFEKEILPVEPMCQYPDYPTGCESVSLTMFLRYYGMDVTPDDVIAYLPQGEKPYTSGGEKYGADPEVEFVGSPYDKDAFGVYNGPIADVAGVFMDDVHYKNNASVNDISEILKTGNPVIAWYTSHPDKDFTYDMQWYTEDGTLIKWPSGEHAVVVCGQDLLHFYYADPYEGDIKKVNKLTFRRFFKKIGGRIVYYEY